MIDSHIHVDEQGAPWLLWKKDTNSHWPRPLAELLRDQDVEVDLRRLSEDHPVWIAGRGATPRVLEEVGVPHLGGDLIAAVAELTAALPDSWSLPQAALRWIIEQSGVTTVIPGARNPSQARANADAGRSELPEGFADAVRTVYDQRLRADIHPRW